MRRALAIFLTLFFGLGPLAALSGETGDARLPACCRRHGAHHCAMGDDRLAATAHEKVGSTHLFASPSHCPLYPHGTLAPSSSAQALTAAHAHPCNLLAAGHRLIERSFSAANRPARILSVRGPPAPALA